MCNLYKCAVCLQLSFGDRVIFAQRIDFLTKSNN